MKYRELTSRDGAEITGQWQPIPAQHHHYGQAWHYTDAAALVGIVENDALWASAATAMNDPSELTYGARRIREWYDRDGNATEGTAAAHIMINSVVKDLERLVVENPAYVVSCSSDSRLLNQWQGYASGTGYAIRLNTDIGFVPDDPPDVDETLIFLPFWIAVRYTTKEQDLLIQRVISYLLEPTSLIGREIKGDPAIAYLLIRGTLVALAAALKDEAFRAEHEVRLISYLPDDRLPLHRATSRGVVPYIVLKASDSISFEGVPPITPLPIIGVKVGPPEGESERQRIAGVRSLLIANGRGSLVPTGAGIPFIP